MKNRIIHAEIFKAIISEKTTWVFISLKDANNIEGWGEATLSGRENEIYNIKNDIFNIILNQNYQSPYDLKTKLPFENIVQASISSAIMQCLWDIEGQINKKIICNVFEKNRDTIDIYANFNRATKDRTLDGIKKNLSRLKKKDLILLNLLPLMK